MTADELIAAALAALDQAAALGSHGARDAAKVLRGIRRLGAPVKDDIEDLREVARLRSRGNGRSAISIVARRRGSTAKEVEVIARRLRRKINGH